MRSGGWVVVFLVLFALFATKGCSDGETPLPQDDAVGDLPDDAVEDEFPTDESQDVDDFVTDETGTAESTEIVFARDSVGVLNVVRYDLATGGTSVVVASDDNDAAPGLSPDETRVVVARAPWPSTTDSEIWVMDVDGTNEEQLTTALDGYCDAPAWVGSDTVVYVRNGDLWSVDVADPASKTRLTDRAADYAPCYDPVTDRIFFHTLRTPPGLPASSSPSYGNLASIRRDGSDLRFATTAAAGTWYRNPDVSAGATLLVCDRYVIGVSGEVSRVVLFDLDDTDFSASNPRVLTDSPVSATDPVFCATDDATSIVFVENVTGTVDLVRVDLAGLLIEQITDDSAIESGPHCAY